MWAPAVVTLATTAINVPINLILIKLYGFAGAAAAFSATRVVMFLMLAGATQDDPPLDIVMQPSAWNRIPTANATSATAVADAAVRDTPLWCTVQWHGAPKEGVGTDSVPFTYCSRVH